MMKTEAIETYKEFNSAQYYDNQDKYYLLPFRFKTFKDNKEILVNDIGEFLIVPKGTTHDIVNRKISANKDAHLYQDLLSKFFISEQKIPDLIDVYTTRYHNKRYFLNNFTGLHIFVITLRCDQTCHYCQVSRVGEGKGSVFDMSKSTILRGIDLMLKSPSVDVTMEFQGGEPLLVFDLIKYAVIKAKEKAIEKDKNISFVICTNLSQIDDDKLAFCKDYNIAISTSLDGPRFVHNENRPRNDGDSFDIAVEGIRQAQLALGKDYVSALMTTTKLSLKHPVEIVDAYLELGFREIFLRPISPYGFALKSKKKSSYKEDEFFSFYKKALLYIIDLNKKGIEIQEVFAQIILRKILTPFSTGFVDLVSPSGIINGAIVFNYNDLVYASDEARMLSEMGDEKFKLGHIHENSYQDIFYGKKAQEFSKFWNNETLAGCSDCAYQPYCGNDIVGNWATQGTLTGNRPTNDYCNRNMKIIDLLFELMERDQYIKSLFIKWSKRG